MIHSVITRCDTLLDGSAPSSGATDPRPRGAFPAKECLHRLEPRDVLPVKEVPTAWSRGMSSP